jgi:hypothetical protein
MFMVAGASGADGRLDDTLLELLDALDDISIPGMLVSPPGALSAASTVAVSPTHNRHVTVVAVTRFILAAG